MDGDSSADYSESELNSIRSPEEEFGSNDITTEILS